jgi:type IV pilus assembly protein PilW
VASRQRGFSLVELMVALAIGVFLCAAFIVVVQRCRGELAANESLARLQDAARQALDVVVTDLEHAGFYGFTGARDVQLVRDGVTVAVGDALSQPDETHLASPISGLPVGAHDCGVNFVVDLNASVQAGNHTYPSGFGAKDCAPATTAGTVHSGSDMLTIRHASLALTEPHAGRVQLYSRREQPGAATLFADGVAPGPRDSGAEIRDVEIRSYYIANNSVDRRGWPALRVKALTEARGAAQFRDDEVMPGVEDLQVEFGVLDASVSPPRLSFVAPDLPGLRSRRLVAVRVWLRVRADSTERGYLDAHALHYADVSFEPGANESTQRRVLIERTVALRNLSPP